MKKTLLLLLAALLSGAVAQAQITEFPYSQGFENGLDGWSVIDNDDDGNDWTVFTATSTIPSHTGSHTIVSYSYYNYSAVAPDNWLVSPAIVLDDSARQLSWWHRTQDPNYPAEHYAVYISTTGNTVDDFTDNPVFERTLTAADAEWVLNTVSLAGYEGETIYVAFRHYNCFDMFYFHIDDIAVEVAAGCQPPSNLVFNNITPTSADMTFDMPSCATDGVRFLINGVEQEPLTSGSYSFTNLTPGTVYTIHLYSLCDGDTSFAITEQFMTECVNITLPYHFGFEDDHANCYAYEHMYWRTEASNSHTGSYSFYSSSCPDHYVVTPVIEAPDVSQNAIFEFYAMPYSGDITFKLYVSTEALLSYDSTFTLVMDTTLTGSTYQSVRLSLLPYAGQNITIAIEHTAGGYMFIDDIKMRNTLAPVVFLPAASTMTDANMPNTYAAVIDEGDLNGIIYSWTSTMEAAGNATMSPADSVLEITYTTGGEDTITVVATNSYGTDSAVMYVHVRNCVVIDSLPWTEDFDDQNGLECWTVLDVDGNGSTWNYNTTGYLHSPYSSTGPDNWVITPAIAIPDENAESLILAWSVRGDEYTVDNHYQVLVSPTAGITDTAFTDTLVDESHPEGVWINRSVSVAQYAGQTVRFAFRHVNTGDDNGMDIDNVCVRNSLAPVLSANAPAIIDVNVPFTVVAVMQEGSHEELTYTWTSTMEVAGNATIDATEDTAVITYTATGIDTLTVLATNSYGSDTVVMYITVRDLNPVAEFPYTTGFEEADSADNASWYFANSANGWYIDSAAAHTGSQALYISSDNGVTNNYTVTATSASFAYRAINFAAAGDYSFSFDWIAQGETNYDYIRAFLTPSTVDFVAGNNTGITTTGLPAGYVALDGGSKLNLDSNWNTQNAVVQIATPGVYLLTFYWRNDFSQGTQPPAAIDNVIVSPLTCSTPGNIVVDNITSDSIAFHWSPRGEETSWEVRIGETVVVVTDTVYVAEDLQASTNYNIRVRAICGEGDTSFATTATFRTECNEITLPYFEDFEDGGEQCWNILNYYTTSTYTGIYTSTTYATSGNKVFRFYPGYNYQPVFAVLPRMNNVNTLMMTFNLAASSYIAFQVGTMATPSDTTTFVPLYTVSSGLTTTPTEFEVFFDADTTDNQYIAIRFGVNSSWGWNAYLDDVNVMVAPSCRRPEAVSVSNIEATAATVTITDTAEVNNYQLIVFNGLDTVFNQVVNSTTYALTGLEANTSYSVEAFAICDDGNPTSSVFTTFRTACANGNCEFTVEMADSYGDGWNGNAINVMQNGQLYESLTMATGYANTVTVTPCLGDPVVLLWNSGSYAYETSFSISNAAGEIILAMDGDDLYSGDTLVVFDGNCGVSYVIDNGDTVGPGPQPQPDTCIAPTNLRVVNKTATNATIDWNPGASEGQWQIELNGNIQTNVAVGHPYVLNGLTAGTQYRVRVRAVCGANMFSEWTDTLVFTTLTDTTGIVSAETIGFGLYPNPAVDKVNIDFDGVALISILDLNGRELIRTDEKTINIEGLSKGTYFVRLTSQEGTAVRKLVIR